MMTGKSRGAQARVCNADLGAKRGHVAQSKAKARRDAAAWEWIFFMQACSQERRLTLRELAAGLTAQPDAATRSGKPWSEMQVSRVFAAKGITPKELYRRITTPDAYERKVWPQEAYDKWNEASQELGALTERNGSWKPTVDHPAGRADIVRFKDGKRFAGCEPEAQVLSVRGGRYRLLILDLERGGTWEMTTPVYARDLETWVWARSRAERIRAHERLREAYFRAADAKFLRHR
jgi:hypothetical protein